MNRRQALLALGGAPLFAAAPARTVLLELFTSQGCSSCPPAETFLTSITRTPPTGIQVITLAEHVDYWDHLGWKDAFAAPVFAARQRAYAEKFKQQSVYAPQFVANGYAEAPGNQHERVWDAVTAASRVPQLRVQVAQKTGRAHALTIRVEESQQYPDATLDVMLAVVEASVAARVERGENAGRSLMHPRVVRSITGLESLAPRQSRRWDAAIGVPFGKGWAAEQMSAVVFLQDRASGVIVGAASTDL